MSEDWDSPEFTKVRALVETFLHGRTIANATHGDYLAIEFCQWMKSHDPTLYAACGSNDTSIYYMALLDWHMDQH